MRALRIHEQGTDRIFQLFSLSFFLALHLVAKMQGCIRVVLTATKVHAPSGYPIAIVQGLMCKQGSRVYD